MGLSTGTVPVDEAAGVHPGGLVGEPVARDLNKARRRGRERGAVVPGAAEGRGWTPAALLAALNSAKGSRAAAPVVRVRLGSPRSRRLVHAEGHSLEDGERLGVGENAGGQYGLTYPTLRAAGDPSVSLATKQVGGTFHGPHEERFGVGVLGHISYPEIVSTIRKHFHPTFAQDAVDRDALSQESLPFFLDLRGRVPGGTMLAWRRTRKDRDRRARPRFPARVGRVFQGILDPVAILFAMGAKVVANGGGQRGGRGGLHVQALCRLGGGSAGGRGYFFPGDRHAAFTA